MTLPENKKTLFAVDCSGSVYGSVRGIFFPILKNLVNPIIKVLGEINFLYLGSKL